MAGGEVYLRAPLYSSEKAPVCIFLFFLEEFKCLFFILKNWDISAFPDVLVRQARPAHCAQNPTVE